SFFFPPRSARSGFAGTGGPSGSGLGFSSGIDEIPGWDGHPNFRTYLRIRRAQARVLQDESGLVQQSLDRNPDSRLSGEPVSLNASPRPSVTSASRLRTPRSPPTDRTSGPPCSFGPSARRGG